MTKNDLKMKYQLKALVCIGLCWACMGFYWLGYFIHTHISGELVNLSTWIILSVILFGATLSIIAAIIIFDKIKVSPQTTKLQGEVSPQTTRLQGDFSSQTTEYRLYFPEKSQWCCEVASLKYFPNKGDEPWFFHRLMQRICFGIHWKKG